MPQARRQRDHAATQGLAERDDHRDLHPLGAADGPATVDEAECGGGMDAHRAVRIAVAQAGSR